MRADVMFRSHAPAPGGRIRRVFISAELMASDCRARTRARQSVSRAAYERAARIGDGFMFSGRSQTEAVAIKTNIEARLAELGRANDEFEFESIQQYSRGDNQWPGDIAAWRVSGGSHISVVTLGANLTTVDGHIDAIRRWRDVYNSVR